MSVMSKEKVIIFSAPSGSGKTSIVNYLLERGLGLEFSISATSRAPRGEEQNGREYFFLTNEEFKRRVANGEFIEWQEVYEGCCYGTLKSEVERIWGDGKTVIFDVDVVGGVNLKKIFGEKALALFIQAPSVEELRRRLVSRGTDTPEKIEQRLAKAEYEMTFAPRFDKVIINDQLQRACEDAEKIVREFIFQPSTSD